MKAKVFDTLRSKVSDLMKEEPVVRIHKDADDAENKNAALDALFAMNEGSVLREVFKEAGTDRPYTKDEIDAFLKMGCDEE